MDTGTSNWKAQEASTSNNEDVAPPAFSEDWTLQTDEQPPYVAAPPIGDGFPEAGEMHIPNVNPMTAHFHLALLRRFCALYEAVEASASGEDAKAKLLQQFLVCAESRYMRYLALLDEFVRDLNVDNHVGTLAMTMPLPPWDVAIIFHAHCLNPFRFYADMNRRTSNLWGKGISFPLERLYALIEQGIWSDIESEQMWSGAGATSSYQLWESDPATGAELRLQDAQMICPWCNNYQTIPLGQFTQTHTTKKVMCKCSSCGHQFNADTLSAKFFQDDMSEFKKSHNTWAVKGVITGIHESDPKESGNADLGFILETVLHRGNNPASHTHLSILIASATKPTWKDILNSIKKTKEELKSARILRLLYRPSIFKSLELAYRGILWSDLSIDLVAACLRQREFAKKITSRECGSIDTPYTLSKAITRYHKFLLLMKREIGEEKKKIALVPTLDIDLCWHTHQLASVSYRDWCVEHLGVAINHDDTVAKDKLDSSLHETSEAWSNTYRESYSTNGQSEAQSPKDSKIGSIFPFKKKESQTSSPVQSKSQQKTEKSDEDQQPYMSTYAYWLKYPYGWNYPAACASESAGKGGWAASVDSQNAMSGFDGGKVSSCAGCVGGGCTYGGDNYYLK